MTIVAIAWIFVVALMAAAEGMRDGLIAAFATLLFYGVLPLSLVLYLFGTPGRRRRQGMRGSPGKDHASPSPVEKAPEGDVGPKSSEGQKKAE